LKAVTYLVYCGRDLEESP